MMYSQKLVACLKSNGKILREFKDTTYVPFGAEFSVLIKNLNSVRAIVNITIDGTVVCPGGLVVNANEEINIERFITSGNMQQGNRFKFIERTEGIEQHRGIKTDDGIIRISFKFEKPAPQWTSPSPWGKSIFPTNVYNNGIIRSCDIGGSVNTSAGDTVPYKGATLSAQSYSANEVGITVPGSISNQQFQTVSGFLTENEEHVIVLRILGETESGQAVTEPVTVKTKPKCITCGRVNKATSAFCSHCGTCLTIV